MFPWCSYGNPGYPEIRMEVTIPLTDFRVAALKLTDGDRLCGALADRSERLDVADGVPVGAPGGRSDRGGGGQCDHEGREGDERFCANPSGWFFPRAAGVAAHQVAPRIAEARRICRRFEMGAGRRVINRGKSGMNPTQAQSWLRRLAQIGRSQLTEETQADPRLAPRVPTAP